ncbi:unnamed protein product [Blepharisma stoltei]|uniref:Uncharacterized protein n=1 Tax=Blepharisma stoltei TaxID=1481888 RepID=A0AAU9JG93_9CILI|nr:unnamed protein product [Blepharisma stoltei]
MNGTLIPTNLTPHKKILSLADVYDYKKLDSNDRSSNYVYQHSRTSLTPLPTTAISSPNTSVKIYATPKTTKPNRIRHSQPLPQSVNDYQATRNLAARYELLLKNDHHIMKTMFKEKRADFEKTSPPVIWDVIMPRVINKFKELSSRRTRTPLKVKEVNPFMIKRTFNKIFKSKEAYQKANQIVKLKKIESIGDFRVKNAVKALCEFSERSQGISVWKLGELLVSLGLSEKPKSLLEILSLCFNTSDPMNCLTNENEIIALCSSSDVFLNKLNCLAFDETVKSEQKVIFQTGISIFDTNEDKRAIKKQDISLMRKQTNLEQSRSFDEQLEIINHLWNKSDKAQGFLDKKRVLGIVIEIGIVSNMSDAKRFVEGIENVEKYNHSSFLKIFVKTLLKGLILKVSEILEKKERAGSQSPTLKLSRWKRKLLLKGIEEGDNTTHDAIKLFHKVNNPAGSDPI